MRNVEHETFKTGEKTVYQSALPLTNAEKYRLNRDRMKDRNAFNYRRSEGSDQALIEEYELARSRRIPRPRLCGVHCTAFGSSSSRSGSGSPRTSTRRSGDPASTLV